MSYKSENCSESGIVEGRLEYFKEEVDTFKWGTVCKWEFDDADAEVACREMGHTGGT